MGGFLGFLFLLLLVVILVPLLRIFTAAYNLRRRFKQATGQFRERQGRNGSQRQQQTQKEKIFTKDVGEYVAFEEIKIGEDEFSRRREAAGSYREVKAESQITDVEFEELK